MYVLLGQALGDLDWFELFGLVWIGWIGLDWFGLVGLVWIGWIGLDWLDWFGFGFEPVAFVEGWETGPTSNPSMSLHGYLGTDLWT